MSDFKHFVKIDFSGNGTPSKWRDDYKHDGSPCEPVEWCIENVGLQGYAWKRLNHSGWGSKGRISYSIFYFTNELDAVQFKLTWSDY